MGGGGTGGGYGNSAPVYPLYGGGTNTPTAPFLLEANKYGAGGHGLAPGNAGTGGAGYQGVVIIAYP
jgi:hypothetical protein